MPDLLSAVVFLPAIGAIVLAFFPADEHRNLKALACLFTLIDFGLSLLLWNGFSPSQAGYQFAVDLRWIEAFGIHYRIGVDGLSIALVLLTTFLMPITLIGAWTAIETRVREFVIAMCLLETGMLGAFVALDLFLFYVFWEAMLLPMYFLIGIWGGQRRLYAAVKFFLFTMGGSLLMLIAIIVVAHQPGGGYNFGLDAALRRSFTLSEELLLFWAFALAFAIKVPMFPVHTWLPDAHTEAPTPGSVILAGVLLKLGVYGFLRFAYPLFPHAAYQAAPVIGWLAVVGIVYGALAAWVQPDMKKLVAYSSVSHLGFCMLGLGALTTEGVTGAVYQCVAHGLSTGALFLLVGVLYERRHTRLLQDYGGIARRVPVFAFFLVFVALASAGLPALSGFPGEFLILLGTYTGGAPLDLRAVISWPISGELTLAQLLAIVAATGVILAAVYLLWMLQKVLFGPLQNPANEHLRDMNSREVLVILPLALMMIVLGVMPGLVLSRIEPAAAHFVSEVNQRAGRTVIADAGAKRRSAAPRFDMPGSLRPFHPQLRPAPSPVPEVHPAMPVPAEPAP
jgi:NADH-quinone oxidoreductase subunit M